MTRWPRTRRKNLISTQVSAPLGIIVVEPDALHSGPCALWRPAAALLDLGPLQLREAVVEDVALAVVALVRARLGEELVAPLPLFEALGAAFGEDVRAAEREMQSVPAWGSIGPRPRPSWPRRAGRRSWRRIPAAPGVAERRREDLGHLDVCDGLAALRHLAAARTAPARRTCQPPNADAPTARAVRASSCLTCVGEVFECASRRTRSDVARDNIRHQGAHESTADSVTRSVGGQLASAPCVRCPADKRSARQHHTAKWMAISGFLPCIVECFCELVSLGQTGAKGSANPSKKNDGSRAQRSSRRIPAAPMDHERRHEQRGERVVRVGADTRRLLSGLRRRLRRFGRRGFSVLVPPGAKGKSRSASPSTWIFRSSMGLRCQSSFFVPCTLSVPSYSRYERVPMVVSCRS